MSFNFSLLLCDRWRTHRQQHRRQAAHAHRVPSSEIPLPLLRQQLQSHEEDQSHLRGLHVSDGRSIGRHRRRETGSDPRRSCGLTGRQSARRSLCSASWGQPQRSPYIASRSTVTNTAIILSEPIIIVPIAGSGTNSEGE